MKAILGPSGGGDLEAFHTRCVLSRGKHANVACWHIATFRCAAELVGYRGAADIGQVSKFMGSRPG